MARTQQKSQDRMMGTLQKALAVALAVAVLQAATAITQLIVATSHQERR